MTNATTTLRYLRWASFLEGLTLILLVCLAVPLKRMAGMPEFVTVMGPIHGLAFVAYLAMVARSSAASLLSASANRNISLAMNWSPRLPASFSAAWISCTKSRPACT